MGQYLGCFVLGPGQGERLHVVGVPQELRRVDRTAPLFQGENPVNFVSVADVAEVSVVVAGSEDVEGGAMPTMRSMTGPLSGFTVSALNSHFSPDFVATA